MAELGLEPGSLASASDPVPHCPWGRAATISNSTLHQEELASDVQQGSKLLFGKLQMTPGVAAVDLTYICFILSGAKLAFGHEAVAESFAFAVMYHPN